MNGASGAERDVHDNQNSTINQEISDLKGQLKNTEEGSAAAHDLQKCIQFVHDLLKGYIDMTSEEADQTVENALAALAEFVP
jgi:phage shock protein A